MSEIPSIEQLGIALHTGLKDLAIGDPPVYEPSGTQGVFVKADHNLKTNIAYATFVYWLGRVYSDVLAIDANGHVIEAYHEELVNSPLISDGDHDPEEPSGPNVIPLRNLIGIMDWEKIARRAASFTDAQADGFNREVEEALTVKTPFEPDEAKLREWNGLVNAINPDTDRVSPSEFYS